MLVVAVSKSSSYVIVQGEVQGYTAHLMLLNIKQIWWCDILLIIVVTFVHTSACT